jgi:anti-sigma factor RsiW
MNCGTCRYELSQCLDGRLASGRRAVVMAHVAECSECDRFWTELQQAQELIVQLPRMCVGGDFRERLFDRIRTGEGTPPAVFHEPVPVLAKVRYALTGAAAAAAVLVVGTLIRNQSAPAPRSDDVAKLTNNEPLAPRTDHGRPDDAQRATEWQQDDALFTSAIAANPLLAAARPVTPALVAGEAAKQFENRFTYATNTLARLDESGDDAFAVREVCANAVELKDLAELLCDLRENDHVSFKDSSVDPELRLFVQHLGADDDRLRTHSIDTVRLLVAPALRSFPRLGRISKQILVEPTAEADGQELRILHLWVSRPGVFKHLFVPLPDPQALEDIHLRGPTLFIRGDCGFSLVAPWSEVQERQQSMQILQRGMRRVEVRLGQPPRSK